MREYIDGATFKNMVLCASAALEAQKQPINDLNVFPVPDGDTGTNMSLTLGASVPELRKREFTAVDAAADCVASALLRGARGNSGVILSLLFRGIAKGLKGKQTATAEEFSKAMATGVELAYKAVMKPAEGTILTVSRIASAAAVEFAENGSDFELMLVCACETGKDALAETINQNPVLKRAGVVDAGGKGYLVILEAMLAYLQGRAAVSDDFEISEGAASSAFEAFDTEEITFGYCTEFIVSRANDKDPAKLRAFLENLGDSIVVVDDDEIIKTHVHTNEPGKVLTEALTYGALLTVKIENMREQHSNLTEAGAAAADSTPEVAPAEKKYGVVVVCAGSGMEDLFKSLGADNIVTGGQTMNPSTEDILKAVNHTPAEVVFVFPNNKNIIMAAEQCAPLTEKKVVVIPTRAVPQGITALLNMDPDAEEDELFEIFNESAKSVHTALVTYAARDSDIDGRDIHAGEYLALLDGALLDSYKDTESMLQSVAASFAQFDPELISVYYGEDVTEDDANAAAEVLEKAWPDAEVTVVNGGQPVYYYMISAE